MGKMSPIKFPMLSSETTKYKKTLAHQLNEASRGKKHIRTYFTLTFYLNIIGSLDFFYIFTFRSRNLSVKKRDERRVNNSDTRTHASTKTEIINIHFGFGWFTCSFILHL